MEHPVDSATLVIFSKKKMFDAALSGVDFSKILRPAFIRADPKSTKKYSQVSADPFQLNLATLRPKRVLSFC